jgi:hypothetical protein
VIDPIQTATAASGDASALVELAKRLEAQGRAAEAIDCLARAARQGSGEAMARLGMKLVTGEGGAPCLPGQGLGLLQEAVGRGNPEAASRLAVLAALGLQQPQSWERALDLLLIAAELGGENARSQLGILAGEAPRLGGSPSVWRRLREVVDLDAWLSPPTAEVLASDPLVRRYSDFATAAACDWLIGQARSRLVRAELYDAHSGRPARDDYRSNSVANFGLFDTNLVLQLLQARVAAAVGVRPAMLEAANVLHYAVGEKFDEHCDYIDPQSPSYAALVARGGQRTATGIIYLNDDYEGGQTEFTRLGLSHKGTRGEAVVFLGALPDGTPDPRSAHAGRAPIRGEKWIVVNFVRDKPQLPTFPLP